MKGPMAGTVFIGTMLSVVFCVAYTMDKLLNKEKDMIAEHEKERHRFIIEKFANLCLDNPNLDDHPAPVIASVRDMMLKEIDSELTTFVEKIKPQKNGRVRR